jgi:7-keto-8-aminopelargonate synthetase-like enzyme
MNIELDGIPGPEFEADGKKYLYFGGTAYLGLQYHPAFKTKTAEYILEIGTHWGASRAGNVVVNRYKKAEKYLAKWAGSEEALTLSSGFLAGRLVAENMITSQSQPFFSPSCHSAILLPASERSSTWKTLKKNISSHLLKNPHLNPVVFTDTVDFQESDKSVYEHLEALPKKGITLVADDSHGMGIPEDSGKSAYQRLVDLGFEDVLVCGSLGKAMGIPAGVVFGTPKRINELEKTNFFSGASPASPAGIAGLHWALETGLYDQQVKKLQRNLTYFKERTQRLSQLKPIKDHAVWLFRDEALTQHLQENSILITDFQYSAGNQDPSPSRIVLSAAHSKAQLDRLIEVLAAYRP